jgi:acyl-homoserine lactone acylase PvdQ
MEVGPRSSDSLRESDPPQAASLSGCLGGGAHAMDGSAETLYRAIYPFNKPYGVAYSAALRMVADLGDPDKVLAVMPSGVSGRTFDRHFTDQVKPFMNGENVTGGSATSRCAGTPRAGSSSSP